ncbi:glycosyltransferase family 1 protein [Luteimonas sp. TWI662]|uniref:glycosyltransferase family 4 protein n=1 Tax=Luteimonas sp. TWI662 TaxID=3136789 RepID=UPI0032088885
MNLIANYSMIGRNPTGLGAYANTCLGISEIFDCTFITSESKIASSAKIIKSPSGIEIGNGKLAALKRQIWSRKIRFSEDHLVYSPTHHGLPRQTDQIITIHDLISLRFPEQHVAQYFYFKYGVPRLLQRCAAVFTVSEATRQDIFEAYHYPLSKIYVVPNSVDVDRFRPGNVETLDPYLLMVGARYPHKNVEEVISFHELWKDRYRLVVTSCSGSHRKHLTRQIERLGLESKVTFTDYLDENDLIDLYRGCSALVYPSKWEGFGIPPLEALACGRPVIASDIPAHREVLSESGIFVELGQETSWRRALSAIQNADIVASKIEAGANRLAYYTKRNALDALERALLSVAPSLERRSS